MTNKILVIGDLILDHYQIGKSTRLSPEAPIPIVNIVRENSLLGGAGNVVRNLRAFGCEVVLFGLIGEDQEGVDIKKLLNDINVSDSNLLIDNDFMTIKKTRVISDNQQIVRVDKEIFKSISQEDSNHILNNINNIINEVDVIIVSDYNKGLLTPYLISNVIKIGNKKNIKVLVDPKRKDFSIYKGAYLLTPNKKEASEATELIINNDESIVAVLNKLKKITDSQEQLVTLGNQGIAFLDNGLIKIPALAKEVFDVSGAGDTVISALAYCLAKGNTLKESILFANKAASIVVSKNGPATASLEEIQNISKDNYRSKIFENVNDFINHKIEIIKDKKCVFTNGCFDILHAGHIDYLYKSSQKGEVLIIGLNSDLSVRALKGKTRPINNQTDRAIILAALSFVDYVILFEEQTPLNLIKQIKPNVLIKGGDYVREDVVGFNIVEKTEIISFVKGKSTSNIINKIKSL